jgi:hypothetical protein
MTEVPETRPSSRRGPRFCRGRWWTDAFYTTLSSSPADSVNSLIGAALEAAIDKLAVWPALLSGYAVVQRSYSAGWGAGRTEVGARQGLTSTAYGAERSIATAPRNRLRTGLALAECTPCPCCLRQKAIRATRAAFSAEEIDRTSNVSRERLYFETSARQYYNWRGGQVPIW